MRTFQTYFLQLSYNPCRWSVEIFYPKWLLCPFLSYVSFLCASTFVILTLGKHRTRALICLQTLETAFSITMSTANKAFVVILVVRFYDPPIVITSTKVWFWNKLTTVSGICAKKKCLRLIPSLFTSRLIGKVYKWKRYTAYPVWYSVIKFNSLCDVEGWTEFLIASFEKENKK